MDGARRGENFCSSARQSGSWEKEPHPIFQEVAVLRLSFRDGDAVCLANPELEWEIASGILKKQERTHNHLSRTYLRAKHSGSGDTACVSPVQVYPVHPSLGLIKWP